MIVVSLLLILAAVTLLVLGLAGGSSPLLIGSIVASLLAAVALVIGARQAATLRRRPGYGRGPAARPMAAPRGRPGDASGDVRSDFSGSDPILVDERRSAAEPGPAATDRDASHAAPAAPGDASGAAPRAARVASDQAPAAARGGSDASDAGTDDRFAGDPPSPGSEGDPYGAGERDADAALSGTPLPADDPSAEAGHDARPGPANAQEGRRSSRDHPDAEPVAASHSGGTTNADDNDHSGEPDLSGRDSLDRPADSDFTDESPGSDFPDQSTSRDSPDRSPGSDFPDRSADSDFADESHSSDFPEQSTGRGSSGRSTGPDLPDAPISAATAGLGEPDEEDLADEDPADEPAPQMVSPSDAVRMARLDAEVLVVDGRPRYHLGDCPHLAGRVAEPLPANEAVELGFSPCGLCRPVDRLVTQAAQR